MHTIILIISLFLCVLISTTNGEELYPSLDLSFPTLLPKNFRLPTDPFEEGDRIPSREGMEKLRASASGQFLPISLVLMLNKIPQDKKVIIVDLREESHGYLNDMPLAWRLSDTTWTNMGKTKEVIEQDEKDRLHKLSQLKTIKPAQHKTIQDPSKPPLELVVRSVATEKELLDKLNLGVEYLRIPITENHSPPPVVVDQLIALMLTLPENKWFHVHCHGGRGRTTTFLVMYDILLNGKRVSLDDIMLRQKLIGGTDFLEPLDYNDFRHIPLEKRATFIEEFYEYATKNDVSKVKYSTWIKAKRENSATAPLELFPGGNLVFFWRINSFAA